MTVNPYPEIRMAVEVYRTVAILRYGVYRPALSPSNTEKLPESSLNKFNSSVSDSASCP